MNPILTLAAVLLGAGFSALHIFLSKSKSPLEAKTTLRLSLLGVAIGPLFAFIATWTKSDLITAITAPFSSYLVTTAGYYGSMILVGGAIFSTGMILGQKYPERLEPEEKKAEEPEKK